MGNEMGQDGERMLRILHITETARGGVGTYIDLLTELERGTAESRVILPDAHADVVDARTPRRTFRYSRRSVGALARLIGAALRDRFAFRPDIIFCHSTFALLPLALLRPISPGTRFIYCAHGWAGAREMRSARKARIIRRIEGTLCGLAHRVVNVSVGDIDYARSAGYRGRQIVIENAVRPADDDVVPVRFDGPPTSIHLLFVGRLDPQKGLDILLEAFARARQQNPALHLHVIGEPVIAQQGGTVADCDGVDFLGWITADRIDGYYRAADLVLVPSRWEGFGLVVIEAYRNGTPVLTSDRGALPSLVESSVTGFSIKLDAAIWADTLVKLDKAQLYAMRPAAQDLFQRRYSADRLGKEINALYRDLTVT